VIEYPGGFRLLEPPESVGVPRKRRREDLDCDVPAGPRVPRPVDLSHPADADGRKNLGGTEAGARRERH